MNAVMLTVPPDLAAVLDALRRRFPELSIWFGNATRRWWAIVNDRLIDAATPEELGSRIGGTSARQAQSEAEPRTAWQPAPSPTVAGPYAPTTGAAWWPTTSPTPGGTFHHAAPPRGRQEESRRPGLVRRAIAALTNRRADGSFLGPPAPRRRRQPATVP